MTENKQPKKKKYWILVLAVVAAIAFFAIKGNFNEINDYLNPPPAAQTQMPADVILYRFDALSNNNTQNVEIWILNDGGTTAKDISVFVRVRDQGGHVFYEGNISITATALQKNETCTADYTINYNISSYKVIHLIHTIEVTWDTGRNTYSRSLEI